MRINWEVGKYGFDQQLIISEYSDLSEINYLEHLLPEKYKLSIIDCEAISISLQKIQTKKFLPIIVKLINDYRDAFEIKENHGIFQIAEQYEREIKVISDNYKDIFNNENPVKYDPNLFEKDFKPYDFQIKNVERMMNKRRIADFSSPGSGKTITAYMAVINEFKKNGINNLIVIGPKSSNFAWYDEWKVLTNDKNVNAYSIDTINFTNKKSSEFNKNNLMHDKLNVIFLNQHKLKSDFTEKLIKHTSKYGLVIDEAHLMKNQDSKRFNELQELSFSAEYVFLLTGTPVVRSITETSFVTNLLWPFIEHKGLKKDDFIDEVDSTDFEVLKNNFSNVFIRHDKSLLVKDGKLEPLEIIIKNVEKNKIEDILDEGIASHSPNLLEIKDEQTMSKATLIRRMQATSYPSLLESPLVDSFEEFKTEFMDDEELENFDASLEWFEKLKETSNFRNAMKNFDPKSPRWLKALELVELHNENIIVWDVFRNSAINFRKFIEEKTSRRTFLINGTVTGIERKRVLDQFKKSKNGILIASPATIAESISLHKEVHIAIYLFRNYVGSHWMQSLDRIHRLVKPGDPSVKKTAYVIKAEDDSIESVDSAISKNLGKKKEMLEKLIG